MPNPHAADEPTASAEDYRAAMRHWPSGVTVVTMVHDGQPHGMTASAFTSVSIAPPMVLVVIDRRWRSHDRIVESGAFCVNVLAADQSERSDRFAGRHGAEADRFVGVPVSTAVTGCPCFDDAVAWFDCRVDHVLAAGDHSIFLGRVVACRAAALDTPPLVFHNTNYRRITADAAPS
ncbi:MAG: flavin reductase family protein [Ardenticatenales bacterium]